MNQPVKAVVSHRFAVPAERVFEAWLDPVSISRWMFGPGVRDEKIVRLTVEPRVGGKFSFVVNRQNVEIDHVGAYLELDRPTRPFWAELAPRWDATAERLLARDSVDLILLPHGVDACEVRARDGRGRAMVQRHGSHVTYEPRDDGDPLGLGGAVHADSSDKAHDACAGSDYPDALVQILQLTASSRAGEMMLSATRGWDFRARYEPIPHVSSHGALHREHMDVPLLLNRPAAQTPRRTVDVMPSALTALGLTVPTGLDGTSFV